MARVQRKVFWIFLSIGAIVGLWSYQWYSATDAVFSDLPQHGISHGSDAYAEIVSIAQRQIRTITLPLAGLAIVSLAGWGAVLFGSAENRSKDQPPARST